MNDISFVLGVIIFAVILIMLWMLSRKKVEHQTNQAFQEIIDSSVQDTTGFSGTSAQKIKYPTYTDLIQYGTTSLPRWDIDKYSGLTVQPAAAEPQPRVKKSLNPYCGAAFH